MVIPGNKDCKCHERFSVMYRIVYFLLYLLIVDVSSKKNKGCKYYERLSVMYRVVYFSSHLLIVDDDSSKKTKEVSIMKDM